MNYKEKMDYIYKNEQNQKYVGEIAGLTITPYIDFNININGKDIWCQVDHILNEWCIHFIREEKCTELSSLDDVFWNSEAIGEVFGNIEIGNKIAYALKMIYENNKEMF